MHHRIALCFSSPVLPEAELVEVLDHVGFADVRVVERFDCFQGTTKERTARKYAVIGNVYARKRCPNAHCTRVRRFREYNSKSLPASL